MRLSLVLVLALAGLAAAVPHGGEQKGAEHSRPRRFLLGWGVADDFFGSVAAQIRHAWAESAAWARHVFSWARRHPEHSAVYRVHVPYGTGVVAIIESGGHRHRLHHHHHNDHHRALVWDGKRLTEQQQQRQGHGGNANNATAGLGGSISVFHAGANHTVPLSAFAKYLSHVAAGSKVHVDIRGSSWSNLRVVLRVVGARGEDQQKSVSVLLSTVLKEAEHAAHSASKASSASSVSSASKESSASRARKESSESKESKKEARKKSKESKKEAKKKSKEAKKEAKKKSKKSKKSSKKSSSSSASSTLRWDGHDLVWADVGSGKHVRRRLRVTQNGVSQVIPFSVLALHLKAVPADSDISFEVTGHTLKDLRVLLHVHGAHKQTVSLLVSKLMAEAEASKHSGSAARARIEAKDGDKKVHEAVPVVSAQQV